MRGSGQAEVSDMREIMTRMKTIKDRKNQDLFLLFVRSPAILTITKLITIV